MATKQSEQIRILRVDVASPVRFISLHVVVEDLLAHHRVDDDLAVDTALRVSISCHVSSVAPVDLSDDSFAKLFSDPHGVSKECLLCRILELKTGEGLVATLCIDGERYIDGQPFLVADVLGLFSGERALLQLDQNDNRLIGIF